MLSIFQITDAVSVEDHRKPFMVLQYNKGKCGVDTLDQLCQSYNYICKC